MLYIICRTYLFYNLKFVIFDSSWFFFLSPYPEYCLGQLFFNYSILKIIYLLFVSILQTSSIGKSLYLIKSIGY